MLNAGVMGFKCFLIHSGVDEFPHVDRSDLEQAFPILQGTSAVVLVCYSTLIMSTEGLERTPLFGWKTSVVLHKMVTSN